MGHASGSEDGVRFAAVGRLADRVLVASYAAEHGDAGTSSRCHSVAMRVLASASTLARYPRLTVTDKDVGTVHYDTDSNAVFLIVASAEYPQRVAFKCIGELKRKFKSSFGQALHKSAEGGLSRQAKHLLAEICSEFADPGRIDKTTNLLREVTEVKGILQDSLSDMLATRDNLEVLEDKTIRLRTEASTFQRKAVDLRRAMWWRNFKLKLILGVVICIILAYILVPILVTSLSH
mmetsp:Transcript_14457/g.31000  ORF Transcript_14457/g.31000 Transcript_14457/m.31000 type:complete len:235 (+) Transcript_14457:1-705(+)